MEQDEIQDARGCGYVLLLILLPIVLVLALGLAMGV